MNGPKRLDVWLWLDRIKMVLEVIAIPLAGAWAIAVFWRTELPSITPRAELKGEIVWDVYGQSEECLAEYKVSFKNLGRQTLKVTRVLINAWELDPMAPIGGPVIFFDPGRLTFEDTALFKPPLNIKDRLIELYPPEVSDEAGFLFRVKKDSARSIVFRAEITAEEREDP